MGQVLDVVESTVAGGGGVEIAVYERNTSGTQTVVMIHGYPDNHRVWDPVADLLAERFHVVTYDVRGAGASGVPDNVDDYRLERLGDDFVAVLDATVPHGRRVHLVGHDWGSIQGWYLACGTVAEERIASYTSVSAPNLDAVGQFMHRSGPNPPALSAVAKQALKSWYVAAFQIPKLAPAFWRSNFSSKSWPAVLAKVEKVPEQYLPHGDEIAQAQRDGANGVNLYRANMIGAVRSPQQVSTGVPVQVVVPRGDRYVSPALAESTAHLGDVIFRHLDGGHWIVLTEPQTIRDLIVEHIDRQTPTS